MVETDEMPSGPGGWSLDSTIGVVGALVLVAAMVGVFAYAGQGGPANGPALDHEAVLLSDAERAERDVQAETGGGV